MCYYQAETSPFGSDAMKQEIRFCRAADGVRLAYATSGKGPPLVMAATWLTHLEHQWRSLAWQPWLEAFTEFTVLRHDSRGCGLSDREVDTLSFENWVRDFACVVEASGFDRFPVVATCWGGPVAIESCGARAGEPSFCTARARRFRTGNRRWPSARRLRAHAVGMRQREHRLCAGLVGHLSARRIARYLRSWAEQMRHAASPEPQFASSISDGVWT